MGVINSRKIINVYAIYMRKKLQNKNDIAAEIVFEKKIDIAMKLYSNVCKKLTKNDIAKKWFCNYFFIHFVIHGSIRTYQLQFVGKLLITSKIIFDGLQNSMFYD